MTTNVFFARKSVIARKFLLDIDTSLAVVTSGLRTNLLLQETPLPKTSHSISPNLGSVGCQRMYLHELNSLSHGNPDFHRFNGCSRELGLSLKKGVRQVDANLFTILERG